MTKKSRKKTAVKRRTKSKLAGAKKSQAAAKTKARAAAGKTKKKAAKKRARKAKPQTLGERVSSAVKAVMDTFVEAERMQNKLEPPGAVGTE